MIDSNYKMQAYQSHELDIKMKTSSGDTINLNMQNMNEMLLSSQKDSESSKDAFSFSSMQDFSFDINSENGIDEQDKKEIEEFMKIAQPYIDNFMQELEDQDKSSPINKIAKTIEDIFAPVKEKSDETKNFAKNSIVEMFDTAINLFDNPENKIEESTKLLSKILNSFDHSIKSLYV